MTEIETEHLLLKSIDETYCQEVLDYLTRNQSFFTPWSPLMPDSFYTLEFQKKALKEKQKLVAEGKEIRFHIFKKGSQYNHIIGDIVFSNIIRGVFCSCFLGYKIDKAEANKGYMHEALRSAIEYVFTIAKLHRIEANVMPHNAPSIKLLEKLGFAREGYSRKYLKINGKWEDHLRYARLNEGIE